MLHLSVREKIRVKAHLFKEYQFRDDGANMKVSGTEKGTGQEQALWSLQKLLPW